jgi:hypothetical protein
MATAVTTGLAAVVLLLVGDVAGAVNLPSRAPIELPPFSLPDIGTSSGDVALPPTSLKVTDVRIEAPPPSAPSPSAVLRFDLANEGTERLGDIVLAIVVVEKSTGAELTPSERVIVGPFTVRGKVALEAGYAFRYEVLLRNLSPDCACVARVDVESAQPDPEGP